MEIDIQEKDLETLVEKIGFMNCLIGLSSLLALVDGNRYFQPIIEAWITKILDTKRKKISEELFVFKEQDFINFVQYSAERSQEEILVWKGIKEATKTKNYLMSIVLLLWAILARFMTYNLIFTKENPFRLLNHYNSLNF